MKSTVYSVPLLLEPSLSLLSVRATVRLLDRTLQELRFQGSSDLGVSKPNMALFKLT